MASGCANTSAQARRSNGSTRICGHELQSSLGFADSPTFSDGSSNWQAAATSSSTSTTSPKSQRDFKPSTATPTKLMSCLSWSMSYVSRLSCLNEAISSWIYGTTLHCSPDACVPL